MYIYMLTPEQIFKLGKLTKESCKNTYIKCLKAGKDNWDYEDRCKYLFRNCYYNPEEIKYRLN